MLFVFFCAAFFVQREVQNKTLSWRAKFAIEIGAWTFPTYILAIQNPPKILASELQRKNAVK